MTIEWANFEIPASGYDWISKEDIEKEKQEALFRFLVFVSNAPKYLTRAHNYGAVHRVNLHFNALANEWRERMIEDFDASQEWLRSLREQLN